MPLARIRTSLASIPHEIEDQLRASGYEIEVVRPDEQRRNTAELELTIDSHRVDEVLQRAAEFGGDVYLSAGALHAATRAAAEAQARRELDEQRRMAERAEAERLLAEKTRADEMRRAQEQEARMLAERQRAREQAERERIETQRREVETQRREKERQEQLQREAELREQQRVEQQRREQQAHEQQRLAELRAMQEREQQLRAEERRRFEAEQARMRAEQERLKSELRRKETELLERERTLRTQREELEKRLEGERAAAKHEMTNPQTNGDRFNEERPAVNAVPISPGAKAEQTAGPGKRSRVALLESGARRMRHKEYRRAAMTAGVLTLIIMVLWIAVATRRPADPLPVSDLVKSSNVEQKAPFGAAKVSAPSQGTQSPPAPGASPATNTGPAKSSEGKPSATRPNPANKPVRTRASAGNDEVVVRHFGTNSAAAAKKTTVTKDNVKVFSDLD